MERNVTKRRKHGGKKMTFDGSVRREKREG